MIAIAIEYIMSCIGWIVFLAGCWVASGNFVYEES